MAPEDTPYPYNIKLEKEWLKLKTENDWMREVLQEVAGTSLVCEACGLNANVARIQGMAREILGV